MSQKLKIMTGMNLQKIRLYRQNLFELSREIFKENDDFFASIRVDSVLKMVDEYVTDGDEEFMEFFLSDHEVAFLLECLQNAKLNLQNKKLNN